MSPGPGKEDHHVWLEKFDKVTGCGFDFGICGPVG